MRIVVGVIKVTDVHSETGMTDTTAACDGSSVLMAAQEEPEQDVITPYSAPQGGEELTDLHKSGEDANVIEMDRDQGNGPTPEEPELGLVTPYSAPQGGEDEIDWPWKKKSLLEQIQDPGISIEALEVLLKSGEDTNAVETNKEQGYGPIHYIFAGRHKKKRELLLTLLVHGSANIDLTTTKHGLTALQIAVQQADLESVKLLVALGADVNLPDLYGKTPLNVAQLKSERQLPDADTSTRMQIIKSDHAMLFESRETWDTRFTETVEVVVSSKHDRIEVGKYLDICRALESVGALPARILDPPSPAAKRPKRDKKNGVEDFTASCEVYRELEKNTMQKVHDMNFHPTPQQALELVKQLQREVDYRRRFGSRILCLDGGGVRGLVQIEILRQIEKKTEKRITELFDWIVGTSTGGIIALALVYGKKSPLDLQRTYLKAKRDVFGGDKGGKGNSEKLQKMLKEWLGEKVTLDRMRPPHHPKVLIPAVYKKDTHLELHFFNNCFDDEHSQEHVWKVGRYTSAAPFYFTEQDNYIDGGLIANNPSEDCLTAIQQYYRQRGLKLPISLLVSIGSGHNPSKPLGPVDMHKKFTSFRQWVDLLELVESAVLNVTADKNCSSRCQEQGIKYFRFNPQLTKEVESNEVDNQKLLDMLWETRVSMHDSRDQVDELVELLGESELGSPHDY